MSEHATTHETTGHVATQEHEHPGEALYIKIALILAVLTGVEVALSYVEIGGSQVLTNGGLLLLAMIKFGMVAAYFMHLKFDNPILRRLFLAGLITAVAVYIAYLVTLNVFI
jgi:cytochrome c oxidase subunit 4